MDSVRKRVMRFSPLREELGLEERLLIPLISTSSLSLELGGSSKRRSKTEEASENQQEFRDIVSVTILRQLWHVADTIFKHLDAVSLLHCEKVNVNNGGQSTLDSSHILDCQSMFFRNFLGEMVIS